MYSVLRLLTDEARRDAVLDIGARMKARRPDLVGGPQRRALGFACGISRADDFAGQALAIRTFLDEFEDLIREARALDANVSVDVAVHEEDRGGRLCLTLSADVDLLEELVRLGVGLDVTLYYPPEPDEEDGDGDDDAVLRS